jgi:hypothetical protein
VGPGLPRKSGFWFSWEVLFSFSLGFRESLLASEARDWGLSKLVFQLLRVSLDMLDMPLGYMGVHNRKSFRNFRNQEY